MNEKESIMSGIWQIFIRDVVVTMKYLLRFLRRQ